MISDWLLFHQTQKLRPVNTRLRWSRQHLRHRPWWGMCIRTHSTSKFQTQIPIACKWRQYWKNLNDSVLFCAICIFQCSTGNFPFSVGVGTCLECDADRCLKCEGDYEPNDVSPFECIEPVLIHISWKLHSQAVQILFCEMIHVNNIMLFFFFV